ncbi:MAG: DUF2085 domain-containing protein [Coriobacteriia bacterium]|nr:DUF2085 domain-containing protein [Coriobacteriia bacterium]
MIETTACVTSEALNIFGFGLCHQFPERSFDFAGVLWAVCARCSGIYVGLVFALVALLFAYRLKQRHGFMAWPYWLFLAAGLAFMGWDGVTSYAHMRETTNFLRWITGIGMGASLAPLVYFLLANNLAKKSLDEPVMGGGVRPWIAVAVSMLASFVLVYPAGPWLGGVGAVIAAICIWITFSLLALVLLGILKPFYRKVENWRNLVIPGALAMILGLLLIAALSLFNALL